MKTCLSLPVVLFSMLSCTTPKFPIEENSYLKLCFIGDTGKGNIAQELVAMGLKHEKCHEIYFLGDLIYPKGLKDADDKDFEIRFNRYYQDLTKRDNHPKLNIILGNHDYKGNPDAWVELAIQRPEIHFPKHYYWKKVDDLCLIAFDTNSMDFSEQEKWIQEQKPNWRTCHVLIALAHHNLISQGPKYKTASTHITEFYEKNILGPFDYLITGHEHVVAHMGEKKGTTIFISGAGGAVARNFLPGYLTMEKMKKESNSLVVKIKTIERSGRVNIEAYEKKLKLSP